MAWKERKGDRWRVVWRKDGKKQRPRYFKDEDDADHFLDSLRAPRPLSSAELIARFSGKTPAPPTPKFIDYARDLVETGDISQGTKDGYRSTIRNHIEGTALSDMRLADITAQDVRNYWSKITPRKTYDRGGDGAKGNVFTLLAKSFNLRHTSLSRMLSGGLALDEPGGDRLQLARRRHGNNLIPIPADDSQR